MRDKVNVYQWGNAVYVDMSIGDTYTFLDKPVKLVSIENNFCTVAVGNETRQLIVAQRALPEVINGVRVFIADNKNVKALATESLIHSLTTRDALVCISDPSIPLLDPKRYTFPISRSDGYVWSMEESSHMFAYYALINSKNSGYRRAHEGIDLSMHDARGIKKHPLVAIESGTVCVVEYRGENESCVIIQSDSQPNVHYVYTHLYSKSIYVKQGQHVEKGEQLAHIWGDNHWGHLHFSVTYNAFGDDDCLTYENRHYHLINCFPQLYELWHGDLDTHPKIWLNGYFTFGRNYWTVENRKRDGAYHDITGYGWHLGTWCTAGVVERYRDDLNDDPLNVRLRKTLYAGTVAEATNPHNYYVFEVSVHKGRYAVKAKVGDMGSPSWQKVYFNDVEAGTYDLPANTYAWTQEKEVDTPDGKLLVRLELKDDFTCAGISELQFTKRL